MGFKFARVLPNSLRSSGPTASSFRVLPILAASSKTKLYCSIQRVMCVGGQCKRILPCLLIFFKNAPSLPLLLSGCLRSGVIFKYKQFPSTKLIFRASYTHVNMTSSSPSIPRSSELRWQPSLLCRRRVLLPNALCIAEWPGHRLPGPR